MLSVRTPNSLLRTTWTWKKHVQQGQTSLQCCRITLPKSWTMTELNSTLNAVSFCVLWSCKWNSIQLILLSGGKHYLHIQNIVLPNAMLLKRPQSVQQRSLGSCNDFCFRKGWDWSFPISHPTCWQYLLYLCLKSGGFRAPELPSPDLTGRKWLIVLNGQLRAGCAASNMQRAASNQLWL